MGIANRLFSSSSSSFFAFKRNMTLKYFLGNTLLLITLWKKLQPLSSSHPKVILLKIYPPSEK